MAMGVTWGMGGALVSFSKAAIGMPPNKTIIRLAINN